MHDSSAPPRSPAGRAGGTAGTEESTLVLRAQDGDILAFAVLLESHEPEISALCLEILHHEAEAELIVQETFLTAWRRLDSLRSPDDFHAWLFRMAAHHSLFVLRNRQGSQVASRQPVGIVGSQPEARRTTSGGVPPHIRAIDSTLITLPVEEHLAWLLHEVDGQTPAEIADILEVTPERVRERIRRAQRAIVTGMEG